jgi:hypothetical protein
MLAHHILLRRSSTPPLCPLSRASWRLLIDTEIGIDRYKKRIGFRSLNQLD